jgi:hypothetical protein
MPRTLLDVEPALLYALFDLLVAERERVVYAQQNFDYKGTKTWALNLSPYVTDPDRFMHIPEKWDGTVVVLGYGITYINEAGIPWYQITGVRHNEGACLRRCSSSSSSSTTKGFGPNHSFGKRRTREGVLV